MSAAPVSTAPIPDAKVPGAPMAGGRASAAPGSRLDRFIGLKRRDAESRLAPFAGLLRVALPLVALAAVLGGLVYPMVYDTATGFRLGEARMLRDRGEYRSMENPRFAGLDSKNRPYVVTGERAVQKSRDIKVYDLTAPVGDMKQGDDRWVYVRADTGRYFVETRMLDLAGHVELFHDKGHTLRGERARVDIPADAVTSDRPVQGQGPSGTVDAQGVHVTRGGRLVVFTGRTDMTLFDAGGQEPEAAAPSGAPAQKAEGSK